jgi:hypothetical protein
MAEDDATRSRTSGGDAGKGEEEGRAAAASGRERMRPCGCAWD